MHCDHLAVAGGEAEGLQIVHAAHEHSAADRAGPAPQLFPGCCQHHRAEVRPHPVAQQVRRALRVCLADECYSSAALHSSREGESCTCVQAIVGRCACSTTVSMS